MAQSDSFLLSPEADPDRTVSITLPMGSLAFVGAFGSLAACYGVILVETFFDTRPFGLNPHVQAVIMWALGLVAVFALWRDVKRHEQHLPVIIGGCGLTVLLFSLYVDYDNRVEVLAYVLLVIGALANQNAFMRALYRTVRGQALQIRDFNRTLETQVSEQVAQIDRLTRLKRFLSPQIADLIIAEDKETVLNSHRRYVACLFCDIRGFTSMSENSEPEDVIAIIQQYHDKVGELVAVHGGTIGYRAGDGVMVFFNDPFPCEQPVHTAVRLAIDLRRDLAEFRGRWGSSGHAIGIGIGIASGYATLGMIGQERTDYTAIGNVVNIASRLCDLARDGEVLIDQRAYADAADALVANPRGGYELRGLRKQVETYEVANLRDRTE